MPLIDAINDNINDKLMDAINDNINYIIFTFCRILQYII